MEDRPISEPEAAVVEWPLKSASVVGPLDHLVPFVQKLRVVARCTCGSAGGECDTGGQAGRSRPIADAVGRSWEAARRDPLGRDDAAPGLRSTVEPRQQPDLAADRVVEVVGQGGQGRAANTVVGRESAEYASPRRQLLPHPPPLAAVELLGGLGDDV